MTFLSLFLFTLILIIVNAFFVTAEFALLRVRLPRLEVLFKNEAWGSKSLQKVLNKLSFYIITSQTGITFTTMAIGFVTLPAVSSFFMSLFDLSNSSKFIAFLISLFSFILVTFLFTVFSDIIPKIISISYVEELALYIAPFLVVISWIFAPISFLSRRLVILVLKPFGLIDGMDVYSRVYSEDELKLIVAESQEKGEIDESEEILINRVLDFTDTRVNEIFTPRYEIVAFDIKTPVDEIIAKAKETGYSRFPVYEETLDNVKGFIHVKDILVEDHENPDFNLESVIRPVFTIHEAMKLHVLLRKMQQDRSQVAIAIDEYGNVEGLVTLEDILEAIVGPIDDEFDVKSVEYVKRLGKNHYEVLGHIGLDEFNKAFSSNLEASDGVTIAGFLLEHLESIPKVGAILIHEAENTILEFVITKMDGNRVEKAEVTIKWKF